MSTETNVLPFVTIRKKRTIQPTQAARAEALALKMAKEQAERDAIKPPPHPYDLARPDMTKLAFAEHILKDQRLLTKHYGHDWLNGRAATPQTKFEAANLILTRLNLMPIPLGKF